MQATSPAYPIQFDVDYPDRPLNRTTTFFRFAAGVLFVPPLLLIVFRQKYPRWWFDFNLAYLRFHNRVIAYVLLLGDEYPSSDDEQGVHLHLPYPDVAAEAEAARVVVR
jgi:hypothetical protein